MVGKPEVSDGLDSLGFDGISRNRNYFKDFFLLFPFWMFLIYMRGVLAECSPGSLVDLIDTPSVVDGRGTTRRTRR
jgi:hypothetical protein